MPHRTFVCRRFELLTIAAVFVPAALWPAASRAQDTPGDRPPNKVLLPNQWSLDPIGEGPTLGDKPMNMRLSPDGRYLAVLHCGIEEHEVRVFDASTLDRVSSTVVPNSFYGLLFNRDGSRLYVSGGESEVVHSFAFDDGALHSGITITLAPEKERHVPAGMALNPDESVLAVAESWGNAIDLVDVKGHTMKSRLQLEDESRPYDCVFGPDGTTLYVSLWGGAAVAVVDTTQAKPVERTRIPTGDHPNEMVLSADGTRLFVANANANTVSIIDTKAGRVGETLNTAMYPDSLEGSTPNSLALSPDGSRLLVANADNNSIAAFDVQTPGSSKALGLVPVGWYPTSVRVSKDGGRVFVANAKGLASSPNPLGPNPNTDSGGVRRSTIQYLGRLLPGALLYFPMPGEDAWADLTERVYRCSPYRADREATAAPARGNPIPAKVGGKSPIKHVIYVIKENRTYDQVLGDMPEGNGDPTLCLFPEAVTPNHHALAREFVLLDNFYVESQVSADGHEWTMGAYATDFVQKTWPSNYGDHGLEYPSEGRYRTASPSAGYIWDKCAKANVTYRSYGEFTINAEKAGDPSTTPLKVLEGHFDPYFRDFDLDYTDLDRAKRFLHEFDEFVAAGTLPQFTVLRLPNDHTNGTRKGGLTPRAMVADNDNALGIVVEAVSKSAVWKDTAIFVVEDDAQAGPDHVDAHRTIAYVISSYTRGRGKDSTFYSTASMLRTMELILGLEPMSQYDAGARPMYNAFRANANTKPYKRKPVSEELRSEKNPDDAWGAEKTAALDLTKEDRADDFVFNEIIWRSVKGPDSPMPAPVRAAFVHPQDDEDEDEDEDEDDADME